MSCSAADTNEEVVVETTQQSTTTTIAESDATTTTEAALVANSFDAKSLDECMMACLSRSDCKSAEMFTSQTRYVAHKTLET